MQTQLLQQSPLAGTTTPFEQSNLRITDRSLDGKLHIEGNAAGSAIRSAFGAAPNQIGDVIQISSATHIGQITPDRYLLTTTATATAFAQTLSNSSIESFVTITDQTDGHGGILITGEIAPTLLSTVCGLDFRPAAFPRNSIKISSVAKVRATIWHVEEGWLLHVGRSYTAYLWQTITDAVHDMNAHSAP